MVEPIAIVGAGCRFPGGADTPSKLWTLIHHPNDLSSRPPATRFDMEPFYHPVGTHHGTTNAAKSYWLEDSDESSVAHFDAGFFNLQATEVDAMDPQQRLLLEVVYDALSAAGQPMERLRGSDTAVYVGMMCDDYNLMLNRDWETLPRYAATGLERAVVANRVSYFFDWHGPSLTIDTACSSSLVAMDQAVQALRHGKSRIAVAAGTSLILSPAMYVSESNLGMLSPSGRCAMWDAAADGYARGEGTAALILKTLSQAIADNDPIECIIRETAVNQDGRTPGLTMPSNIAQAALIRQCYASAGLDPINNLKDRPQFFQAHGTGTQAGDPREAEAISSALFPSDSSAAKDGNKLLVGSVKTVIGHTEGTAGIASVIGTLLALKHGIVPPNLHFQNLNHKVAPFFKHLEIPTSPTTWPTAEGHIRRASVNSFGFGGTNAHCILEEYAPAAKPIAPSAKALSNVLFTPITFSAASETALQRMLSQYLEYLKVQTTLNFADFAYTLQHRRSTLPYRSAIAAPTVQDAIESLENIVSPPSNSKDKLLLGMRFGTPSRPAKVLGVFTGQGAQWPRMGAQIIESSPFAASLIDELDADLQGLPDVSDRPAWTIKSQLLAHRDTSRIAEAALSQPLCTAVQILLIEILSAAGVIFTAVVGHSSGEIGAAYAAGLVSARDAIRIAYFRGVYAELAKSPNHHAPRGAMLAVGVSVDQARNFCEEMFSGRIEIAAVNSDSSITLSGDVDAVDEAEKILNVQGLFARKLKVDTAYHSAHMAPCAGPYLASLQRSGIRSTIPRKGTATVWFSSVYEGELMTSAKLTSQYWVDNMCNTVLFAASLDHAINKTGTFDIAIEVGPHPALQGPATTTIDATHTKGSVPYTGLLSRGKNDIEQLSKALGSLWTRLGSNSVQFSDVETLLSGTKNKKVVTDLPLYPFDHQRTYWTSSRVANHFKHRRPVHNPILGTPCSEATTPGELQWRNILRPTEIPWLKGHMLQGQTVFPATGYISMAVEAIKALACDINANIPISVFKLTDVEIPRAIAFSDDAVSVETIFSLSSVNTSSSVVMAEWACYSVAEGVTSVVLNAKGRATARVSPSEPDTLPLHDTEYFNMVQVRSEHFYDNLSRIGYDYSPPFRGVSDIKRKLGYSVGTLLDQSGSGREDDLVIHPGLLDSALQTIFAAWSSPGDTQIWALHVPVSISAVTINNYFTTMGDGGKQDTVRYETFIRSRKHSEVVGDICLQSEDDAHALLHFEGATLVPFTRGSPKNDLPMFSQFQYKVASPDGQLAASGESLSDYEVQMYKDIERIAYWYLRNVSSSIPTEERHSLVPHFQKYLRWCDLMSDTVSRGAHPKVLAECNADSRQDISQILARYKDRKDVRFVQVVGDNLIPVIRAGSSMLEHMNQDSLLHAFYADNALCTGPSNRWLARIVSQISYRFPALNIFEVGAGTGATTEVILGALEGAYSSYTFTDISNGFFMAAEERFGKKAGRMVFKNFDMEKSPSEQLFYEGSYDVVVAVNVLHVSADMETSLANVRRLLKPGGFLVVGELTSTDLLFTGMTVGTLPGWWIGAEAGRPWGPLLTLPQWDTLLKKTGFAGIDTTTPDISSSLPMSVFVAQATNDQVRLLRDPLAADGLSQNVQDDALAIIGGTTVPVQNLSQEVRDILSYRFRNRKVFKNVEDFSSSNMARSAFNSNGITILCLTDLDTPFLDGLTIDKFNGLKTLWATAGTLIWVTSRSRENVPHSYMMMGIARTIKTEYPKLDIQMLDLDFISQDNNTLKSNTAAFLAETLLRQQILHAWGTDTNTLLWTAESEVFVTSGRQMVTRLLPDLEKNKRYNSQRREIFTTVDSTRETLQLTGAGQGQDRALELYKTSPLRLVTTPGTEYRTVRVTHSLLQSLAIDASGFFRLCAGVDVETGEAILALSDSTESPMNVSTSLCIPLLETPAASTLVLVAAGLLAVRLLTFTPRGGTLLVNEPDPALEWALQSLKNSKSVNTVFTTSDHQKDNRGSSIFIHPNFAQRTIESLIPTAAAVFVHFSRGAASDASGDAIAKSLSPACVRISEDAVLSHEVNAVFEPGAMAYMGQALHRTWDAAYKVGARPVECIAVENVTQHKAIGEPLAVVDWTTSDSITVREQPIDSGVLFRSDRTYLFVGMAGELGQSLAGWMIAHGARCIVLTSRTPKVTSLFVDAMAGQYGAVVKTMSVDITSRESLWAAHNAISASLPPIAGVVNGAMILDDELFANMTYEQFTRVTMPKVLGTQLLDDLFYNDTSLDFFLATTSIASVIGWNGQSNYSAANEFMVSLMCQRRRRGVPGSAMSIPGVVGVGYAAQQGFNFDYFQSLGYLNISEEDLHILFAEAMLSGRPGAQANDDVNAQVAMGVNFIPSTLDVPDAYRRDTKFGHFTLPAEVEDGTGVHTAAAAAVPVKTQLQTALTREDAYRILRDAFVAHLRRYLRVSEEQRIGEADSLVELGVDSLVGVDIRAWFSKELGADVPALTILGGGSIADLVRAALEKMPGLRQEDEGEVVAGSAKSVERAPEKRKMAAAGTREGAAAPKIVKKTLGSHLPAHGPNGKLRPLEMNIFSM